MLRNVSKHLCQNIEPYGIARHIASNDKIGDYQIKLQLHLLDGII